MDRRGSTQMVAERRRASPSVAEGPLASQQPSSIDFDNNVGVRVAMVPAARAARPSTWIDVDGRRASPSVAEGPLASQQPSSIVFDNNMLPRRRTAGRQRRRPRGYAERPCLLSKWV